MVLPVSAVEGEFRSGCGSSEEEKEPYYKVIVSNHVVEIYEMQREPFKPEKVVDLYDDYSEHIRNTDILGYSKETGSINLSLREEALQEMRVQEYIKRLERESENKIKEERKAERRAQTLRDARNKCRRLAIANFNEESIFMTLTVAKNEDDVDKYDNEYRKFIKRLKYKYQKIDYIAVREFQKRGAIHYHVIMNIDFQWKNKEELRKLEREIAEIWGHGFVDIQRLNKTKKEGKNVDNVGAYLTKYMSKEFDDTRLKGKKAYLPSRGLLQPYTITGDDAKKLIESLKGQKKETFVNSYFNEYLGKIKYTEINLKRQ